MNGIGRRSVGRVLGEGLVIVVSVLVALAVDAWWSQLQDRARVAGHLQALSRDFHQMSDQADQSRRFAERGAESAVALVEGLRVGTTDLLADSAYRWLSSVDTDFVFSPRTGAYDALVASADLELIPDEALKREVGRFFGALEVLRIQERDLAESQSALFDSETFARLIGRHRMLGYPGPMDGTTPAESDRLRSWAQSDFLLHGLVSLAERHSLTRVFYEALHADISNILILLEPHDQAGADS